MPITENIKKVARAGDRVSTVIENNRPTINIDSFANKESVQSTFIDRNTNIYGKHLWINVILNAFIIALLLIQFTSECIALIPIEEAKPD